MEWNFKGDIRKSDWWVVRHVKKTFIYIKIRPTLVWPESGSVRLRYKVLHNHKDLLETLPTGSGYHISQTRNRSKVQNTGEKLSFCAYRVIGVQTQFSSMSMCDEEQISRQCLLLLIRLLLSKYWRNFLFGHYTSSNALCVVNARWRCSLAITGFILFFWVLSIVMW